MDKLNANAGLIILIVGVVLLAILILVVWLLAETRKKLAIQRLKFIGQFSADPDTRKMVANITISNRSLSDITLTELGLRNGKVNFNYTDVYKKQYKLGRDARVVVGQRDAIRFTLSAEELVKTLIQSKNGKVVLKKISVYAMDSTGIPYVGRVADVKKLLAELAKNGVDYLPPAFDPSNKPAPTAAPTATPTATPTPAATPNTYSAPSYSAPSYTAPQSTAAPSESAPQDPAPRV